MNGLRRLKGCPVPPLLERGLGYPGQRRYVAFYWMPCGDELVFDDGEWFADGDWDGWLLFRYHPLVQPHLAGLDLGSSETEAVDWLLLDRRKRQLLTGRAALVRQFLELELRESRAPRPKVSPPQSNPQADSPGIPPDVEQLRTLLLQALATKHPALPHIEPRMQAHRQVLTEMKEWLDHSEPPRLKKPEAVVFSKPIPRSKRNDDLQKSHQSASALTTRAHRSVGKRQNL